MNFVRSLIAMCSCLYNSMKRAGLGDVDACRDQYVQYMNQALEYQFQKPIAQIVREDPTLDQGAMGSANFLQMYCSQHPHIAFVLAYTAPDTGLSRDWFITGSQQPQQVVRIQHSGSFDGGHFEHRANEPYDLDRARLVWTRQH